MTNPLANHLLWALRLAEEAELGCIVIGGHAVIFHGVPRFTRDIDFAVLEKQGDDWRSLLEANGYRCYHTSGAFAQYREDTDQLRPDIDLMLLNQSTWEKVSAEAIHEPLDEETSANFPSAFHLLAMKLHAACDPKRRASTSRDWDDVIALCRSQEIDPRIGPARDLVLRYADENTLDRLLNALKSS